MRKLFNDEAGFVISAELVLVLTIGVLAMVVGVAAVRDSVSGELTDLSNTFGAFDQSYNFRTVFQNNATGQGLHSNAKGSGFNDRGDDCDCVGLTFTDVTGKSGSGTGTEQSN